MIILEPHVNGIAIFEALGIDYWVCSNEPEDKIREKLKQQLDGQEPEHFKGCQVQREIKQTLVKLEPMWMPECNALFMDTPDDRSIWRVMSTIMDLRAAFLGSMGMPGG